MHLEYSSVAVLHALRGHAKVHGSGDVCGAVQVLPARVQQEERVHADLRRVGSLRVVMDDCAVGRVPRDGREGRSSVVAHPAAELLELVHRVNLRQRQRCVLHGRLQPVDESCQRGAISNVRLADTVQLHLILDALGESGWRHVVHC